MNVLDIIVLAVIALSGLMSFRVGLVREVFALGALLVGIFAALILTRAAAPKLPVFFESAAVTQVLAFVVIFLVIYLIVSLIGSLIARVIRSVKLGWADHLLGFVFGCLRGAVIGVLLLIAFILVLPAHHALLRESRAREMADGPIRVFAELLPARARTLIEERHAGAQERTAQPRGDEQQPRGLPL
ncbi:MAG: CvpA family protein [Candidatus Eisenbacteria bacterium]